MIRRRLGNTDLDVSILTLGTWSFGGDVYGPLAEAQAVAAVRAAVESGINLIDTAPIYGAGRSETLVGRALRGLPRSVLVATKCGLIHQGRRIVHNLAPDSIRGEIEESLRRLGRDCIDLYQCHWPDPETPIEATMETLLALRQEGKIRHIGVSNFPSPLIEQALGCGPVCSLQSQYSLLDRTVESGPLPCCRTRGVGFLAYGPMAGGLLTGKYRERPALPKSDARSFFYPFYREPLWSRVQQACARASEIAGASSRTLHEAALCWVVQQPGVTSALVGCRTAEQVKSNARCVAALLPEDALAPLASCFEGLGAD